jgi:hypothetical protein
LVVGKARAHCVARMILFVWLVAFHLSPRGVERENEVGGLLD